MFHEGSEKRGEKVVIWIVSGGSLGCLKDERSPNQDLASELFRE